MQLLEIRIDVVHHGAFGQFDDEVLRLEPGHLECNCDVVHQLTVLQVAARNIDRDPQPDATGYRTAPLVQVTARLRQDPAAKFAHVTAFFSDMNKPTGEKDSGRGVSPADE